MALTKRTHINPCFWTALWNSDYFEKFLKSTPPEARNQKVIYLEINSDKKIIEKTKNVHFEKGLGLAEISPEGAKNYCKKYFPEEYDNFCKEMDKNPKHLTFDFENHFTAFEKLPPYQTLLNVIKKETIDSFEDKVNISLFLILHNLRSHCFIRPMTQLFQKIGDEKFALLLFLKQKISNHKFLLRLIWPIANAQWSLFKSDKHQYPLTDNPVTIKDGKVIAVLSPKLVLFVDLKKNEDAPIIYKRMSLFRYQQFKKRMISNTLKGIVFPNEKILKKWQKSRMWQKRRNFLKKNKSFISSIRKDDNWEIWIKNGSGLS